MPQMPVPAGRPQPGAVPLSGTVVGEPGSRGTRVTWKQDASDAAREEGEQQQLKRLAEQALAFVERVASQRAGEPARARTVAFCGSQGTVAYSMIGPGSHFCERVGRKHASNRIFFVLNFTAGMFAQK